MNIRKIFSLSNITTAVLYGGGLFGMHISLLIAVIIYIPSRYATIPFRGGVLMIGLLAIYLAFSKRHRFYRGKLWIALIVFWSLYGLSIVMEPAIYLQQSRWNYALYAFGICAIPMAGYLVATNSRNIKTALVWLTASAFVAGALSIALYGNASLHGSGRATGGEFIGNFVAIGPLLLSYAGSAIVALGIYWVLVGENQVSIIIRYVIATLFVLMGAYLMALGASRGPIIAVFVPCVIFMVCRVKKASDVLMLIFGFVLLFGAGVALLLFAGSMGSALVRRLEALMYMQDAYMFGGSGVGRIDIYKATIAQFFGNPLLGNGLNCREVLSYPHNFILEAYMTTGVFGGTAFLIYFCTCVSRAIKIIRYFPAYSWVSLFFLHYAVYVQLSSGIITNHAFWYSSAMVIAVYEFATKERPHIQRRRPVRQFR